MDRLLAGVHHFQTCVLPSQRELFRGLARGQDPLALFITCADSRIVPNLITNTEPGDLFLVRNVGNLVPPCTEPSCDPSSAAAIELAVSVLKVPEIIVCGHIGCSAIETLLRNQRNRTLPSLGQWLQNAESTRAAVAEEYGHLPFDEQWNIAVQHNVLAQLDNLASHPAVASRLARGKIDLFGWVYKIETGEVFAYDSASGRFVSVADRMSMPTEVFAPPGRLACI